MPTSTVALALGLLTSAAPAADAPLPSRRPSVAPRVMQTIAPDLARYTDDLLFGDVWIRPQLRPRDRSLVTLAVLVAGGRTAQLRSHVARGLDNGLQPAEVTGLVTHLAFYTGWPNAVSALPEVEAVFRARGIDPGSSGAAAHAPPLRPRRGGAEPDDVEPSVASTAPKLARILDEVVAGDLWRRTDLTPRDRSLITIAALAAAGDADQLAVHLRRGAANGLTRPEIAEALTHLGFYAGLPKAIAAIAVLDGVAAPRADGEEKEPPLTIVPRATGGSAGPPANFTGDASVTSPFRGSGGSRLGGATVSFVPGARTNWHTHPLGQLLVVTAGRGWVQAEGQPVRAVGVGDVVWTAPGVRHWHGATRTDPMTHVAVAETSGGRAVTWLEPVPDALYRGP